MKYNDMKQKSGKPVCDHNLRYSWTVSAYQRKSLTTVSSFSIYWELLFTFDLLTGDSANAVPHTKKLRTRVAHIWGNRRLQPNRSAMERPRPGETAFLITVLPVPGKYALPKWSEPYVLAPVKRKNRFTWGITGGVEVCFWDQAVVCHGVACTLGKSVKRATQGMVMWQTFTRSCWLCNISKCTHSYTIEKHTLKSHTHRQQKT